MLRSIFLFLIKKKGEEECFEEFVACQTVNKYRSEIMYTNIIDNVVKIQKNLKEAVKQNAIETMMNQMLENANPVITNEDNDNIQNFPNNPGPSNMEIQLETFHDNVSDKVSKSETENSSMEYSNAEVIDIPSDSDDDRDYYYHNDSSNLNDVSIIDTVKLDNDIRVLRSPLHETSRILVKPLIKLLNPTVANSSDTQIMSNSNIQDETADVEENNNDIIHEKTVSEMKRLSESPKPGCSKDFDDSSSKLEDSSPTLDELLKDTRLIHALLPKLSYRFIYRTLCSNQFAKNRIELTLWDLLPVKRPLPQVFRKRKSTSEICIVDCKKNSNASLQKDQVDTKTVVEIKEQCMKSAIIGNIEKLEDRTMISTSEIDETKRNVPEVAVLNDTNNEIDQSNVILVKTKSDTLDEESQTKERDYCINRIVEELKKCESLEPQKEIDELHWKKNLMIKKKPVLLPNNSPSTSTNTPILPVGFSAVLKPAKLTFENNLMRPPNIRTFFKPPNPILSPPKLQYIVRNSMPIPCSSTNATRMRQMNTNLDLITHLASQLPRAPIDKETSRIGDAPTFSYPFAPPVQPVNPQGLLNLPRNVKMEDTEIANVCATYAANEFYNRPSSSTETTRNSLLPLDHQSASSSKACYNFDQEAGNMSTPQICDRGDEQQQNLSHVDYKHNIIDTVTNIIQESTAQDADNKEVKTGAIEKPKYTEKDVNKIIILSKKANAIYVKLIPMFPSVKSHFIKQLCHDYIKDSEQSPDEAILLENLIDMLLNCGQENLRKIKPMIEESDPSYDMNEQYADLLMIFPEADPVYLRKITEELHGNHERIKEFVQSKLENPDYPTRAQYLAKKKITEQQKQYTTDFKVQQFLEIFPDPFSHFEDEKRNCQFNPHAIDFLKYYFSKLRVNTLVKAYSKYMHNLSLTAKALEALNPDMKTKRQCNKMVLTENIPFLQECAFIQHKTELRKYLDEEKTKEEQEFNELKTKGQLFECQCCYDNECMPSKCSTCEDGHIFCNLCIMRSTDVVLGDGNTRVDCLLKCGCEFPISVLQQVLSPTKFSILLCKRQEAEVIAAGVEGLVSCPFCHFASIPPPEDKIFKCLNPECMKESCRLCKELNHVPLKCNEKKSESARLYLEEKMTEALVRKCYRCSRMFFKEEGCNKMTCICGAQMCYICDKPVTDYKHFQGQGAERSNLCPLWSDDRRLNAESVIKVCKETIKQIKEKDPKIEINVEALLPKLPPKSKGPHDDIYNAMVHVQSVFK